MSRRIALAAALVISVAGLAACGEKSSEDGATQQTKGEIKEGVGGLIGDDQMKQEGQKDQVVGGVKETVEDVGDAVKGDSKN